MNIIGNAGIKKIHKPVIDLDVIRRRRETECFPIVNRGVLWYNCLTIEQRSQLNSWYHAWLNATETHVIPQRPSWLNEKIEKEEILL